jgi:hypothetical protein
LGINDSFDSATESNRQRGFLDPDVPIGRRKKKNNRVKTSPEPSNEDPLPDDIDEIPTEAESTDSVEKSSYHSLFLITRS